MGSGASNGTQETSEEERTRKRKLQAKVRTVGFLSKFSNWRQREKDRMELRKNMEQLKQEKKVMFEEIDEMNSAIDDDEDRFRRKSTKVSVFNRNIRDSDKPMWAAFESDAKCFLCRQRVDIEVGFPCRVCTKIFHEECLQDCGECRKIDRDLCHRARSNTGWSCYICGNLGLLLTDEEMGKVVRKFERYDINQDTTVSEKEYCRIREEEFEEIEVKSPGSFDVQRFLLDFRLADVDCDGKLDWWEFVNHEAQQVLIYRSKDELVDLLTEKELLKAKSLFRTFDRDDNGFITEISAKEAYRLWYQKLESTKKARKDHGKGDDMIEMQVNLCTSMLMQMNDREHDCILWSDFLDDQALYLITSRPNQADIFRRA